MSLDIPICKYGPLRGMFPAIVPGRFSELGSSAIDCFDRGCIADTVMVRSESDYGTVLLVELDVFVFELAVAQAVEVPEAAEAGPEGSWDGSQRGYEGFAYPEKDLKCYEEKWEENDDL
jgi:hypothetical protein